MAPTFHIHGEYDALPWQTTTEIFYKNVSNYHFSLISNAGHFPWLDADAKEEFLRLLEKEIDGEVAIQKNG